jgi:predicted outer membrane repeat protein
MKTLIKLSTILLIIFSINYQGYSQITPVDGIVYVRFDGAGNGSSWVNATNDLQGAIDAEGVSYVYVGSGAYFPTWHYDTEDPRAYSFKLKNNVIIMGSFPIDGGDFGDIDIISHPTILSGDLGMAMDNSDNAYHVVYCDDSQLLDHTARLENVVISYGNANVDDSDKRRGGGVYIDKCSPMFYECIIRENEAIRGAGVYSRESSAAFLQSNIWFNSASETGGGVLTSVDDTTYFYRSSISYNSSPEGAGMANVDGSTAIIKECSFAYNNATTYGGAILNATAAAPSFDICKIYGNNAANGAGVLNSSASPLFVNTYIAHNEATSAGGGVVNNEGGAPRFINCNIMHNVAPLAGGIANNNATCYITNSIVYYNGMQITNVSGGMATVSHSCVEGGWTGTAIIDEEPMLESELILEANLQYISPLINAGINDSLPAGFNYDYFLNERIVGDFIDIGIAESTGIIYVNADATGYNYGTNWDHAFTSLESALSVASSGNQIWIAEGIYKPSAENGTGVGEDFYTFKLKSGVAVYGGFNGMEQELEERNWSVNRVYLDGNLGSNRVFHVVTAGSNCNEETILDGVTIRNGQASGSTAAFRNGANLFVSGSSPKFRNLSIYSGTCGNYGANVYVENSEAEFDDCSIDSGNSDNQGGGIALHNSSAKFNNCNISDNYAYGLGGGVNVAGTGTNLFNSCSFTENRANDSGSGGAFFVESNVDALLIVNCYFAENIAAVSGGAIDLSGTTTIVNSTFGSNYAQDAGAMGGHIFVRASGSLDIYNSVLYAGSADNGEQVYAVSGSTLLVKNSMIEDCGGSGAGWNTDLGTDDGGNIDFNDYWWDFETALNNNWPGIDAGYSEIYNEIELLTDVISDFSGYPRLRGNAVDMGHKEIPYCWLQVGVEPAEVVAEAQWSYNGGADWHSNGDGFWEVPQEITVEFSDVTGYTTPESQVITMDWGGDYVIFGEYVLISAVDSNLISRISVYPNPSTGIIYIENTADCDYSEIGLMSLDGKVISLQKVSTVNSFDMQHLPSGMYIIKAGDETVKVIKN